MTETPEQKAIRLALKELFRLVHLAHEPRTSKERRIMVVAKAMCRSPEDANCIVTGVPGVPCLAGNNAVTINYPIQPAWATFGRQAAAAVEAVDEVDSCAQD